jgi:cytochrome c
MYETVKAKFPHLSDEDRLDIAKFALDCMEKETKYLWEKIARIEKSHSNQ